MKVLSDVNVLMDVFAEREPFCPAAASAWGAAEAGRVHGVVSAVSCGTVYYLARRLHGRDGAPEAVRAITSVFEIAPVDRQVIQDAMHGGMADFEDALQAVSGRRAGATHIVSRDASGFVAAPLPSMSPDALLRLLASRP